MVAKNLRVKEEKHKKIENNKNHTIFINNFFIYKNNYIVWLIFALEIFLIVLELLFDFLMEVKD